MKKFIKTHIATLPAAIRDDEFNDTQMVIMTIGTFIIAGIAIVTCSALLAPLSN